MKSNNSFILLLITWCVLMTMHQQFVRCDETLKIRFDSTHSYTWHTIRADFVSGDNIEIKIPFYKGPSEVFLQPSTFMDHNKINSDPRSLFVSPPTLQTNETVYTIFFPNARDSSDPDSPCGRIGDTQDYLCEFKLLLSDKFTEEWNKKVLHFYMRVQDSTGKMPKIELYGSSFFHPEDGFVSQALSIWSELNQKDLRFAFSQEVVDFSSPIRTLKTSGPEFFTHVPHWGAPIFKPKFYYFECPGFKRLVETFENSTLSPNSNVRVDLASLGLPFDHDYTCEVRVITKEAVGGISLQVVNNKFSVTVARNPNYSELSKSEAEQIVILREKNKKLEEQVKVANEELARQQQTSEHLHRQLFGCHSTVVRTQEKVDKTEVELRRTQAELTQFTRTSAELTQSQKEELTKIQEELQAVQTRLVNITLEHDKKHEMLTETQQKLTNTEHELNQSRCDTTKHKDDSVKSQHELSKAYQEMFKGQEEHSRGQERLKEALEKVAMFEAQVNRTEAELNNCTQAREDQQTRFHAEQSKARSEVDAVKSELAIQKELQKKVEGDLSSANADNQRTLAEYFKAHDELNEIEVKFIHAENELIEAKQKLKHLAKSQDEVQQLQVELMAARRELNNAQSERTKHQAELMSYLRENVKLQSELAKAREDAKRPVAAADEKEQEKLKETQKKMSESESLMQKLLGDYNSNSHKNEETGTSSDLFDFLTGNGSLVNRGVRYLMKKGVAAAIRPRA